MFERFTERGREVVVLTQDEARALGHRYIGTEHLLLGLLREEEGLAAKALHELGFELEGVRADVVRAVGRGDDEVTEGQIPFTPRVKQALELSVGEADALGHREIGTEHLLLGLVRLGEGIAVGILTEGGALPDLVRQRVADLLAGT